MNLDVAPFTDVHVRKAVAWVLDKSAMLRALGGASHYSIATHIIPPTLPGGLAGLLRPVQDAGRERRAWPRRRPR